MSAVEVDLAPVTEVPAAPPVVHEDLPKGLEATFHLDEGLEDDPDNYLVIHELLGRGHLLNAYEAKMSHQHEVDFGVGILNKGKKNVKREKRQPTQIEIMAAVEREKQEKKAARKAAKEAKADARKEKEFLEKFGERKLTKKERKALEESGLY